jgi:hypothetical protein
MAITLQNQGNVTGGAFPNRIYKLVLTLDGSATTGSLAHLCPAAPVYYQNALGGTGTAYVSKAVANSGSATTVADITVSSAGSNAQTLFLLAYIFNQGT